MAKKSRMYIWQFVIGLGFLSGLWTAIGIDPQAVIVGILGTVVDTVYSDPAIRSLFLILPAILLIFSVYGAYTRAAPRTYFGCCCIHCRTVHSCLDCDCTRLSRDCHHYRVSRTQSQTDKTNDRHLTFATAGNTTHESAVGILKRSVSARWFFKKMSGWSKKNQVQWRICGVV